MWRLLRGDSGSRISRSWSSPRIRRL